MNTRFFVIAGIALVVLAGAYTLLTSSPVDAPTKQVLAESEVTLYRSPLCGCCENYVTYLERSGISVTEVVTEDIETEKQDRGVPTDLYSCHTTLFGDYTVEGHIPLEAVAKLMLEQPDIAGIALPGMPAGAPGMGGAKTAPFQIHSFSPDGEIIAPFITL